MSSSLAAAAAAMATAVVVAATALCEEVKPKSLQYRQILCQSSIMTSENETARMRADDVTVAVISRHFDFDDFFNPTGPSDDKCLACHQSGRSRSTFAPPSLTEKILVQLYEKQTRDWQPVEEVLSEDVGRGTVLYRVLEQLATEEIHAWLKNPAVTTADEQHFFSCNSKGQQLLRRRRRRQAPWC